MGSEIEQAVISAMHYAFAVKRKTKTADLLDTVGTTTPLVVTMAEKIDALCQWGQQHCVPTT